MNAIKEHTSASYVEFYFIWVSFVFEEKMCLDFKWAREFDLLRKTKSRGVISQERGQLLEII